MKNVSAKDESYVETSELYIDYYNQIYKNPLYCLRKHWAGVVTNTKTIGHDENDIKLAIGYGRHRAVRKTVEGVVRAEFLKGFQKVFRDLGFSIGEVIDRKEYAPPLFGSRPIPGFTMVGPSPTCFGLSHWLTTETLKSLWGRRKSRSISPVRKPPGKRERSRGRSRSKSPPSGKRVRVRSKSKSKSPKSKK